MSRLQPIRPLGRWLSRIELGVALLLCVLNLLLLAVPLVGLMFLPGLFGSVAWAGAASGRSGNAG
jgi:hypothetical protein